MSSSNSPCAACKFQRRKCTQECVFAPYFPPDQPQKFENVHKVFGASNVSKILNELNPTQREDAVNSLAYEAEARLRDPVYGCVGLISVLQHKLMQVQSDLYSAKKELATYLGPQAMLPITPPAAYLPQQFQGNPSSSTSSSILPYNVSTMLGNSQSGNMLMRDSHHQQPNQTQQQILEAQQLAAGLAAREQQDMVRGFEVPKQLFNHQQQQHQQAHDLLRFNGGGYDPTATGMSQMGGVGVVSPSLALGNFDSPYPSHQLAAQLLLSPQQTQVQQLGHQSQQLHHEQKSEGEEDRNVGPSG